MANRLVPARVPTKTAQAGKRKDAAGGCFKTETVGRLERSKNRQSRVIRKTGRRVSLRSTRPTNSIHPDEGRDPSPALTTCGELL